MKRFIFLIFLFMCIQLKAQWTEQTSGVTEDLWDVCFVDSLTGWVVGGNSILLRTNNGGENWEILQFGYETDQNTKIYFIDELNGFLLTKGSLYTTKTSGNSWEKIYTGEFVVTSFVFSDLNKGWITIIDNATNFTKSYIMHTTNRGTEWKQQFADSSNEKLSFFNIYVSDTLGVASGFKEPGIDNINTHFLITLDGGINWNRTDSLTHLADKLTFLNNAIIAGGVGLDVSENYGNSWEHNFDFSWVKDFSYGKDPLWLINSHPTYGHNISYTYNNGHNWINVNLPDNLFYNSLDTYYDKYVWLVGNSGKILKYKTSITSVNYNEQTIPGNIILLNNYPNPFNSQTNIKITLSKSESVSVIIFNSLGEKINLLYEGTLNQGGYNFTWEGIDDKNHILSSGIYFLVVKANNFFKSIKLLLIK